MYTMSGVLQRKGWTTQVGICGKCRGRPHLFSPLQRTASAERPHPASPSQGVRTITAAAILERGGTDTARPSQAPLAARVGGRTVVVTGGSQGCGRATALRFGKEGYNVVIIARDAGRVEAAAQEVAALTGRPRSSLGIPADITSEADVAALVEEACSVYETIDVVVNNAGVCMSGPFEATSLEDFRQQMDVNFFGAVSVSQGFLPALKRAAEQRGTACLAFVNSFGGKLPLRNMPAYTASKFALAGFVDAVRPEMEDLGISVSQIHPGVVNSNFLERAQWRGEAGARAQSMMKSMEAGGPIIQTPEEVAEEVWQSVAKRRNEVFVGSAFKAIWAGYKTLGVNPFLLAMPEQKQTQGTGSAR